MSRRPSDDSMWAAIRPLDLAAYLRSKGWTEVLPEATSPTASWEKAIGPETIDVLVPKHADWRDYSTRIREVVRALAEVEARSEQPILRDISSVSADVIRLRARTNGSSDGTIPLVDGQQVVAVSRGIMLSAACATIKPKRAFHTRKPGPAVDYLASLRMGQSERGSYVVTVLSPVAPALSTSQLILPGITPVAEAVETLFSRRVTLTMITSLQRVLEAAQRAASSGELTAFEESVEAGVSADLCEAIALVLDCNSLSGLDIDVGWAPARPGPAALLRGVKFERDILEVVREAGRMLREKDPVDDFELLGPVIKLDRPADSLFGTAIVMMTIDGRPRKVSVQVGDDSWKRANEAMTDRQKMFKCVGELQKMGKRYEIANPRQIEVIVLED